MPYIYAADLWCDACGQELQCTLPVPPGADPNDECTFDSDDYPKRAPEEPLDAPRHCAGGADCLDAIDLYQWGLSLRAAKTRLEGAESRFLGAIVGDGLTAEGAEYLRELLANRPHTSYQRALHRLWREVYADSL